MASQACQATRSTGRHSSGITDDAEDRVPWGFGPKGVQRGVGAHVEVGPADRDFRNVMSEHRRALLWSGLYDGHRLGMPSTTQGDLPSRPRIPHPSQLPIGRDEPPLPTLFRPRTGVEYDSPLLRPRIVNRYVCRGPSPVRTRTRTRWFSSRRQTLRQYCAAITAPQLGHTSASLA